MTLKLEDFLPPAVVAAHTRRQAMMAALREQADHDGPDSLSAWSLDQIERLHAALRDAMMGR